MAGQDNIDTTASSKSRAQAMWKLLTLVTDDFDDGQSDQAQGNIRAFLLSVAYHEGAQLRERVQRQDGPARSFFQFEAHRAKDAGMYANSKDWIGLLVDGLDASEDALISAFQDLPSFGQANSARFPAGNLVERLLRQSDLFGARLARIAFKKVPEAIPSRNNANAIANYWFKYWKVTGDENLKAIVAKESAEVLSFID